MEIKASASLQGLNIVMRPVLIIADDLWREFGRPEGVTVTSGTDGTHSAGSLHYYGYALDFRIRYFSEETIQRLYQELCKRLSALDDVSYECFLESDHIHVEYEVIK